jgi:hypothetical protein
MTRRDWAGAALLAFVMLALGLGVTFLDAMFW